MTKRAALVVAVAASALPLVLAAGGERPPPKSRFFHGRVVPVAEAKGEKPDIPRPVEFVLDGDDGKVYPLVKDIATAMYYKDKNLLRRPMRITGYLNDAGLLQAVNAHSVVKGKLHEIYYWCEVCVIKRFIPGICDCCGAPLEFREVPLKK